MSKIRDRRKRLERFERVKYKTERRIDFLKRNLAELTQVIEQIKKEILNGPNNQ